MSEGEALFGDGNVETGVVLFEKQHCCNRYCLWPGVGLDVFGRSRQPDVETVGSESGGNT